NIAFSTTGATKLLDFGLATLIRPSMGGDRHPFGVRNAGAPFVGTPAYLPPEAYRGAPPGPAFDLWSLSVTMMEAITGVSPYSADSRPLAIPRIAELDVNDACGRICSLPALRAFFERALARQPELRFQTSLEIQFALEALSH